MIDWDQLYIKHPEFCIEEIAQEVKDSLSFIEKLPGKPSDKRIYDLGFGAGRHILFFAALGYQVYGDDISQSGLEITTKKLKEKGFFARLGISDMTSIPYEDNFFDAIINRGVITHNIVGNIEKCVDEMYRALKPGGIVMTTFISTESSEFGKGTQIEPNTYVPDSGPEEGVPHHFMNEKETRELMSKFRTIKVEHYKHKGLLNIGDYISAHWIYFGMK